MAATGYVYPGRVVKIDPGGPLVVVPMLAAQVPWGPLESAVADLQVGDRVIVTSLGTTRDQLIIIGRLPGRASSIGEIPDLTERLDDIDAHDAAQDGRLTTVEGRATTVEGRATSLEGRTTAVEGVNTTQNTRLTATEGVANGAASGLTTLRSDTAGKVTAKGDLLAATAAGTLARVPVGASGLDLVADPAQPTGLAYAERRGLPYGGGLPGATTPARFVGSTTSGAPTTGTFAVGDFVIDQIGVVWVCTAAGTPGTWTSREISKPFGHAGVTGTFQALNATGVYVTIAAAQVLRGGMTFNAADSSLVVPIPGLYRLGFKGYFTGGSGYAGLADITVNETAAPPSQWRAMIQLWKADANDYIAYGAVTLQLNAGDKIRLFHRSTGSTWGATGYNGAWMEVEYLAA